AGDEHVEIMKRDRHLHQLAIGVAGHKHDVITLPHRTPQHLGIFVELPELKLSKTTPGLDNASLRLIPAKMTFSGRFKVLVQNSACRMGQSGLRPEVSQKARAK